MKYVFSVLNPSRSVFLILAIAFVGCSEKPQSQALRSPASSPEDTQRRRWNNSNWDPTPSSTPSTAPTPAPSPAPSPKISVSYTGPICSVLNSTMCIDVSGASSANGTTLKVAGYHGGPNQKWTLSNGTLQSLGKCFTNQSGNTTNGTPIVLWDCNGGADQRWELSSNQLKLSNTSKCAVISGGIAVDSAPLVVGDCNGNLDRQWKTESTPTIQPTSSPTPTYTPPTPLPSTTAGPSTWGSAGAVLKMSVEFTTPEYTQQATQNERIDLMSANELSPVVHFNDSTYFVWTNTYRRTMVTQIKQGQVETVPLDSNPDYTRAMDGHGRFSLGVDRQGYIHITGDMHNYTEGTTTPYLPRYQQQTILYWKSNSSQRIADGFVFAGGKGSSTAIPGTGWTFGHFFTDMNGELYYSCRVKGINGQHVPGEIALGLYRYDTSTSTWTALGNLPPKIHSESYYTYYKVVLWENAGFAPLPNAWFQGIMPILKFDLKNKLHMASSINSDPTLPGNDRVIYAVSPDGGSTWQKANGAPIQGSLVRAVDGLPSSGDVVVQDRTNANFNLFTSSLTDQYGTQAVMQDWIWRIWNGSSWVVDSTLSGQTEHNGTLASNGSLVFVGGSSILHTAGFGKPLYRFSLGQQFMKVLALDEYSLRTTGEAYAIGYTPDAKNQVVFKVTAN